MADCMLVVVIDRGWVTKVGRLKLVVCDRGLGASGLFVTTDRGGVLAVYL